LSRECKRIATSKAVNPTRSARAAKIVQKADIRSVAREAGVSTATVSRTLSGRGHVAPATRQRVLEAAERLDYSPSAAAASLRTDRTMIVGVMVPSLANPVFVPFLRGVQHVAQAHGYAVLVADGERSLEVERQTLTRLRARSVDCLMLAGAVRDPGKLDELREAGVLVVDPDHPVGDPDLSVEALERPGTVEMCQALAALGHRRLAYVTRDGGSHASGRRRWGTIESVWDQLGGEAQHVNIGGARDAPLVAKALRPAVAAAGHAATALVCSTHGLAPTLLRGLTHAGVRSPEDCSFVTYGDSDWAEAYRPSISVVSLDLYELAVFLTRAALALLAGDDPVGGAAPSPGRFVRRGSVGPPP
jgi:LacI family transcriptional regulator